MKPNFTKKTLGLLAFLGVSLPLLADGFYSLNSTNPDVIWKLRSNIEIGADSFQISKPGTGLATQSWVTGIVPGTVFASYVEAGLEKDPNYGTNINEVDETKYNRPYFYRTTFRVPADFADKKVWLNFEGTNRYAIHYLNGRELGRVNGHVKRARYDITGFLNKDGENVLAVRIDIPTQRRTRKGDGPFDIFTNTCSPTYVSAASWDWMPYVPGLETGITDDVYLTATGDVAIVDPWVRTKLNSTCSQASVSIAMDIENVDAKVQTIRMDATINPGNISLSKDISLTAKKTTQVTINPEEFSQLVIQNPKLWWPNGSGEPNLYTCNLKLTIGGQLSSEQTVTFGIRKYEYKKEGDVLQFYVNGKKTFLRGGSWGMSEYLLRCRGAEYDEKIRMHRHMNYNMIRCWTGCVTDAEFYEACDRVGIMVWDDFWLVNSFMAKNPGNIREFLDNAVDKIKRNRNHPCVAVWCGANEMKPEDEVDIPLRQAVTDYDGDDRIYISCSNAREEGLSGSGWWSNMDPEVFFTNPVNYAGVPWGLRSEIGTATFPTFESVKEFMPRENWWPLPSDEQLKPEDEKNYVTDVWNMHFFGKEAANASPVNYKTTVNKQFGESASLEEFCEKSQFLNMEVVKAMYEGWNDHLWSNASGILLWMSQPAYPSFVWQTYDYYHETTGAYWGAKKGCEPLHVQWNCANGSVKVINTTSEAAEGLTVKSWKYAVNGTLDAANSRTVQVNAPANKATECFVLTASQDRNIAKGRPVTASETEDGNNTPEKAVDGDKGSRWSSKYSDEQWIYVDLGESKSVEGVILHWESHGRKYKIQVSDDAVNWKDVYVQDNGQGNVERIKFAHKATGRYVKMQGIQRATMWGYSLFEFEVYEQMDLNEMYFVRLELSDKQGKVLSDNFYWMDSRTDTNQKHDYTALNTLPRADLGKEVSSSVEDGHYKLTLKVTNNSSAIAFGIRVRVIDNKTGKRVLPVFMEDNYFTLLGKESKVLHLEFDEASLSGGKPEVLLKQYGYEEVSSGDVGIRQEVEESLYIYPNPARDFIRISSEGKVVSTARIYTVDGVLVDVRKEQTAIDVSGLRPGLYLLDAAIDNVVHHFKFVKE